MRGALRSGRRAVAAAVVLALAVGVGALAPAGADPAGSAEVTPKITLRRIAGPDRYATAAALVNANYAPGSRPARIYVTTGENYPDALATGPAAANADSPLLLVRRDSVPDVTLQAIASLDPNEIIVVGGPAAISANVIIELERYAPVRIAAGADRYTTAAIVAAERSVGGQYVVWVASGVDFRDALIAGGAASYTDDPMLLVPPSGTLPPAVISYLDQVRPQYIILVGTVDAVGASIESEMRSFTTTALIRIGNPDLYERSAAVWNPGPYGYTDFPYPSVTSAQTPDVALVTSADYPDGLAAAAWSAFPPESPLYLSERNCIPFPVAEEIVRLNPVFLTLVGGTAALGPGVEAGEVC